jgi:hypothetical protein
MPKKQPRAKGHPSNPKTKATNVKKGPADARMPKVKSAVAVPVKSSPDLATQVKRLMIEVEAIKVDLSRRHGAGSQEGGSRRDQDKILADRLARFDEKIESLWGRVSDIEEHFEGEPGGRTREPDFDETPERDFYEH